jgi:tetratricopeptide (TPR) repeat protein
MRHVAPVLVVVAIAAAAGCRPPPPPPPPDPQLLADPPPALQGDSAMGNPELDRGIAFVKNNAFKDAVPHLEAALEARPNSPEANFYLALAYDLGLNDKKRAEGLYKRALELDSTLVDAAQNLSAIYLEEPIRVDEAIAAIDKALKLIPGDTKMLTNLAYAYSLKGDVDRASRAYEELLPKEDTPQLRFAYGTLLFDAKRPEAAVPHLVKAAKGYNDDVATLATIARMLGPGKAYAECVRLFDRALELKKDVAEFYVRRGLCKHELRDERAAKKDYEAAIRADAKYQPAYYYLGVSLLELGKRDEGRARLKQAMDLGKDTPFGQRASDRFRGRRVEEGGLTP